MSLLDHFRVARLRYTLEADAYCELPPFRGSLFRGLLGWGLKAQICQRPLETRCEHCSLRATCEYPALFEPALAVEPGRDQRDLTPPFVVRMPADGRQALGRGDTVVFEVVLFGSAVLQVQWFANALAAAAARGHTLGDSRAGYRVSAVEVAVGADTWTQLNQSLPMASVAIPVAALVCPDPAPPTAIGVVFETPLRLKHQNHVSGWPRFGVLVDRLAARVLRLLSLYHSREWAVNLKDYSAGAHAVVLTHGDLAHVDVRRRSSRQGTTMDLPGVVGTGWYAGEIHPYLPLLRLGEFTHVGKNTSAGFGRIRVVLPPGDAPMAKRWHTSSTKPPR